MEKGSYMKEKTGVVFSIALDNPPVPGCTVSKGVYQTEKGYISYFSLAEDTDISAEVYPYHKLILMAGGEMEVFLGDGQAVRLSEQDCLLTPVDIPVGMRTKTGGVYTEISVERTDHMNKAVKPGEVFKLAELVPYQEGRIVNMDVVNEPHMKFVVMAFDGGTGLAEHAAPGEALVFALDGEGIIGYEGTAHTIHAGETFRFAKLGKHWVKAEKPFKMALLLTLES